MADIEKTLKALRSRGVVTGILSNGDPDMLGIAVRSAGLEGLLDHVISVDPMMNRPSTGASDTKRSAVISMAEEISAGG